mmetsp:Transcript_23358/g.88621  ORF Transcript_23358/g.88621 Transcript_23358/m.88621 type:complete len:214 (+) Transcript_23358:153-794(+)
MAKAPPPRRTLPPAPAAAAAATKRPSPKGETSLTTAATGTAAGTGQWMARGSRLMPGPLLRRAVRARRPSLPGATAGLGCGPGCCLDACSARSQRAWLLCLRTAGAALRRTPRAGWPQWTRARARLWGAGSAFTGRLCSRSRAGRAPPRALPFWRRRQQTAQSECAGGRGPVKRRTPPRRTPSAWPGASRKPPCFGSTGPLRRPWRCGREEAR